MNKDHLIAADQPLWEVVPEHNNWPDESNLGMPPDVLLQADCATAHSTGQPRDFIAAVVIVVHLDVDRVPGNRRFASEPLAVKQEDARGADNDMIDVSPVLVVEYPPIR